MIDLGFLTEAEQEAILQVLQRDAQLKKAEEERVRHLQDVVSDENELKYKSGQWFYDAKSKRHSDKIHGADLVRASIRKRKKPATIAELSEMSRNQSKRRSVNSINKDLFIPPELFGVMEVPDEADEDLKPNKVEANQSSKRVSFIPSDKDKDILKNGLSSPAKQRKNPFNSEGLEDVTGLGSDTTDSKPQDVQVNGQPEAKPDIMSSIIKYGVKLPYPELKGGRSISQKTADDIPPKPDAKHPVPKPRTFYTNGQVPQPSDSFLKREDSINGTNRRGILKRRSSSSSTDSESVRIPHSVDSNKIVMPVSPIPEAGQNYLFDEQLATSEGSPDRQKQVRFSEKVLQKPPSPKPEPYSVRETDEFGILEPGVHLGDLDSESVLFQYPHSAVDYNNSAEVLGQNGLQEKTSISSLDAEELLVDPDEEISNHRVPPILEERHPERSVDYNGTEPLYAVVNKTPQSASSDQAQVFAMEDAQTEPRFLGQEGKTPNMHQSEKPLVFGQSYGGGGKISFEPRYPTRIPKESYNFTREQVLAPERAAHVESPYYDLENKTMTMPQYDDDYTMSVATWKRPVILENKESLRKPTTDDTEQQKPFTRTVQNVPKVDFKEADRLSNTYPENEVHSKYFPGEYKREAKYESLFHRNTHNVNDRPAGPTLTSANFKVMSLKERMNELPKQQMSDPAQFQSLKHFWNVEEKNSQRADVGTSPNKLPTDILSRNKPTRADLKQRNSKEMPADDLILPNTFDILSDEEQNSQKVASWLAQTPTVYGVDQVDHRKEQFDPSEVTENIQISSANKKNNAEDFTSSLQKLQMEALESPRITEPEKLQTQEISAASPNSMENTSAAANIKSTDRSFYDQVLKRSNEPSTFKETKPIVWDIPTMHNVQSEHNAGEPVEETVNKTVAPAKEESAFSIGFEKLQTEYSKPHEEHQTDEPNLSIEDLFEEDANEPEEVIKKSTTPKSRDQQDFIFSLNKLEMEASKPPLLATENKGDLPNEEITLNTVSPVKSSYKIGFEHISPNENNGQYKSPIEHSLTYETPRYYPLDQDHSAEVANKDEETVEKTTVPNVESDLHSALKKLQAEYVKPHKEHQTDESNLPIKDISEEYANESNEVIKKSTVPKSQDQQDFIFSLNKLEMEASKPPLLPTENQNDLPDEDITMNTVSPVKSSYKIGFEHISPNEAEETVGKTTMPNVESDLSSALKKLELEAQSINENVDQDHEEPNINSTSQTNKSAVHGIYINSSIALSPTEEEQPDLQLPYSSRAGRSVASVEEPPIEGFYEAKPIFQIELPKYTVNTQENLPVKEEEAIERTVVKTQENSDFPNQLMRLQDEAATVSEEPEDPSVGDTVIVSQFPNRKIISKTVFPSIESLPRYSFDTYDAEETNKVPSNDPSPWRNPKDPNEQKSPVYSRLEELAKHPRPADKSGSYQGSARNVLYKKPESSTGVSNSEPGKPAPTISSSDSASSKHDKYTFEVMKAQDESISKVLDWFSRSSDTGDEQSPSVGLTEETKNSQRQLRPRVGTSEDESGAGVEKVSGCLTPEETEFFSESELPKMVGNPQSKLSIGNIENISADQSNIPNAEFMTPVAPTEEDSIPLKQVHSHSKAEELLEFGKSGGGCGKINNHVGNDDFVGKDLQMVYKPDVVENHNEGIKVELESGTLKPPLPVQPGAGGTPVYTEDEEQKEVEVTSTGPTILEPSDPLQNSKNPDVEIYNEGIKLELESGTLKSPLPVQPGAGGTPVYNEDEEQKEFEVTSSGPTILEPSDPLQNSKKPDVVENHNESIKIELESCMLKPPLPVQAGAGEIPVYSEDEEQKEVEVTSSGPTILEPSDPLQNSKNPDFENHNEGIKLELESGTLKSPLPVQPGAGGTPVYNEDEEQKEFEVTSSRPTILEPSDPLQNSKKPDVENHNEGIKIELESCTLKPPLPVQAGAGEIPVYSEDEEQKEVEVTSSGPTILEPSDPLQNSKNPDFENHNEGIKLELESGTLKSPLPVQLGAGGTPVYNEDEEQKEFEVTSSGPTILEPSEPLQNCKNPDVENDNEGIKIELEAGMLKPPLPVQAGAGETPVYSENEEQKEVEVTSTGPILETSDPLQNSKNQELEKLNITKKRVSDIKQFWEGEKPSQSVPKKLILKSTFSPNEQSITPNSSFDSDDQNGSSIVTFKKVMLEEDDDDQLSPIDQLKSFWENEKSKEIVKGHPGGPVMKIRSLDIEKVSPVADPRPDFRKRYIFNFNSEIEQITGPESNAPQRSVSLGENKYEGGKHQPKSINFQSLRSFWSVDSNSKGINPRIQALSGTSNRQFNSNPDIRSRDPLIAKIKTKLASKSLENIRDSTPDSSQLELYDQKHDGKHKVSIPRKFNVEKFTTTDPNDLVQKSERFSAPKQQFDSQVKINTLNKKVSAERSPSVECEFGDASPVLPSSTSNITIEVKQDKTVPKQAKDILNDVERAQNPDYSSDDDREECNKQPDLVTLLPQQNNVKNLKNPEPSLEEKSVLVCSSSAEVPVAIENPSCDTNLNKLYNIYSTPDEPSGTEITPSYQNSGECKVHELNPSNSADPILQQDSEPKVGLQTYGAVSDEIPSKTVQEMSSEQLTEASEFVLKSFAPRRDDVSLSLQKLRDEWTDDHSSLPREQASVSSLTPILSSKSIENQLEFQDEENGEHIYSNVTNDSIPINFFVKQGGFDNSLTKSPVDTDVSGSPANTTEKDHSESVYAIRKDTLFDSSDEPINENVGKTVVPPKKGFSDFDKGLQNLYNESLDAPISPNKNLPKDEYIEIQEPGQGIGEVLAVSSSENGSKVQRSSSTDKKYTTYQPLILNISSKKTDERNEDLSTPYTKSSSIAHHSVDLPHDTMLDHLVQEGRKNVSLDTVGSDLRGSSESTNLISEEPTSKLNVSFARETEVLDPLAQSNYKKGNLILPAAQSIKEIEERIPSPIILSRTPFFHFDERLKKLYEESSDLKPTLTDTMDMENVTQKIEHEQTADVYLYSSEPKTTILNSLNSTLDSPETMPADRETLIVKSADSDSQAPDILVQEVEETIEKSHAPKTIPSYTKRLEKLQREAMDDEEGRLIGNVPPNAMATSELQPKLNENVLIENRVSATPPEETEVFVQEKMEPDRFEESRESTSETKLAFTSLQQSTPVKEKNSSLRRSTLELYLEAPYRREISKSIDFDLSGYITSGVDKERCMEDSNPILSALNRSTAKTLNSKAVQEVSPTSTNEVKLKTPHLEALGVIKLTSINAKGLNTPEKRSHLLRTLRSDGVDVALIQETHFKISARGPSLVNQKYPLAFYSNNPEDASIGSITWSDHAPVSLSLSAPSRALGPWTWRLNESLLYDAYCKSELDKTLSEYFDINDTGEVSEITIWEAHKCVIRGKLIQLGSFVKKNSQALITTLLHKIHTLETRHKTSLTPSDLTELSAARAQLRTTLNNKTEASLRRCNSKYYKWGNKPGRLLAQALRTQRLASFIPSMKNNTGSTCFKSPEIAACFKSYYNTLYNLGNPSQAHDPLSNMLRARKYLADVAFPQLSKSAQKSLEAPFTLAEVDHVISIAPLRKSPGPDGFTATYYKMFKEMLAPKLLQAFNSISAETHFSRQSLEAHITVIPKQGKDPSVCSSYRPISLLNIDLKFFAKLMALRLNEFLPSLVHNDQVGFVPGREAKDNTTKLLNLIHLASSSKISTVLLSTDAEKAFDRVNWDFMRAVLEHIGLGPQALHRILSLYTQPSAKVRVNGTLSDNFLISNGTRQGCPLSPLIFVLCIEALARAIRTNDKIKGLQVGDIDYKLALFADDLLATVTDPTHSLPNLMSELDIFSSLSGFKINTSKSYALHISTPHSVLTGLKATFPFQWRDSHITYLGVQLSSDSSRLLSLNFHPILQAVRNDYCRWQYHNLSWLGRINVVKMNTLPKLLYLLQTLPIQIPDSWFRTVRSLIQQFIWRRKRPRIKRSILTRPPQKGGFLLPDIEIYYQAILLNRVLDWTRSREIKQWVVLEGSCVQLFPEIFPWLPTLPKLLHPHPTISPTLSFWKRTRQRSCISSVFGPLTSFLSNPTFPPGLSLGYYRNWALEGLFRVGQLVHPSGVKQFSEIREKWEIPQRDFWKFLQIRHFLHTNNAYREASRELTAFEKMCVAPMNPIHTVSTLYKLLCASDSLTPPHFIQKWERDLNISLSDKEWDSIFLKTHKSSICIQTPAAGIGLENRGEIKLALKYNPLSPTGTGTKAVTTGEVHIWIKDCLQLPMLRENKINSFVKCTILPDTSRKSRQKTRTVDKTTNPIFNHTMVYDGFKEEDLREACVELTVWDHNRLSNHFIGGLRLGLGTGKSYGTAVDWMDSSHEETTMWDRMITSPNTWVEGLLPLRMFKMAKIAK
ncbi:synaptotagmin-like protein 2 [Pseudophryne corroboree]|uniref:synaptotagmin-like protein 2 n=1 Tax=Pseudophryne corroboree TaxID=495146 RepID=UPI003081238A